MSTIIPTYDLAWATGADAANRHCKEAGREHWNGSEDALVRVGRDMVRIVPLGKSIRNTFGLHCSKYAYKNLPIVQDFEILTAWPEEKHPDPLEVSLYIVWQVWTQLQREKQPEQEAVNG